MKLVRAVIFALSAIWLGTDCPAVHKGKIKIQKMKVTAYCPCERCCGKYADGITASGHIIKPGDKLIAADKTIPFGTKMYIPGYGPAEVLDRGGKIKGNHIDIFFDTHQQALNWGVKELEVYIYEDVE